MWHDLGQPEQGPELHGSWEASLGPTNPATFPTIGEWFSGGCFANQLVSPHVLDDRTPAQSVSYSLSFLVPRGSARTCAEQSRACATHKQRCGHDHFGAAGVHLE